MRYNLIIDGQTDTQQWLSNMVPFSYFEYGTLIKDCKKWSLMFLRKCSILQACSQFVYYYTFIFVEKYESRFVINKEMFHLYIL